MAGVAVGLFFIAIFAVSIGGLAFWIVSIIEVAKIPDHQYRAAGTEKLTWVLIVALAGWIGALIWRFAKRDDVVRAFGRMPAAPPGWYPDPSGHPRWWDGQTWGPYAGQVQGPPGQPPA